MTRRWHLENRDPTPTEWVQWFTTLNPEEQLAAADRVIRNTRAARECATLNHRDALEELHGARQRIAQLLANHH